MKFGKRTKNINFEFINEKNNCFKKTANIYNKTVKRSEQLLKFSIPYHFDGVHLLILQIFLTKNLTLDKNRAK